MLVEISDYVYNKRETKVEFSRHDLMSLDATLALVIAPALRAFKEKTYSIPGQLNATGWHDILDKMAWSFEEIATGRHYENTTEEYYLKVQEGFDLFAKYYLDLWI